MRLVYKGSELRAHFTVPIEIALLEHFAEQGVQWISIVRAGETDPVGALHTQTHEVRLYEGATIVDRQVVVLGAPEQDTEACAK